VTVCGHRIPDGQATLDGRRIPTRHIATMAGRGRLLRGLSYLASALWLFWTLRRQVDVAYVRGLGDGAIALCLAKAWRIVDWPILGVPINARGTGDAAFLESVPGWRLLRARMDRHIERMNLINEDIAADLDRIGLRTAPRSRIPNGIAVRALPDRAPPRTPRQLIWTGRMERQKGLDVLLDALAALGATPSMLRVLLVGDGPLAGDIARVVEARGLSGVVEMRRPVPADEVRDLLIAADGFVLPSRYEGMSNAALEAMEVGLPILCTRCGGIDRVVADGAGWVCEPGDIEGLAAALRLMLDTEPPRWREMGRRSRALVEQRFRIEDVATRNLALLADLVALAARR
jgi:glycosyltransferase involved in cell wall biosynthesis